VAAVTSRVRTIAVLGAGPKAVSLATKRRVLKELGFDVPEVVILERRGVGANWTGEHGYTDGQQPLGTSPEKDVGYPYHSTCWGEASPKIDQAMMTYSWHRHLVARGAYARWVDRGRPPPSHRQWAEYVQWAAASARACVRSCEVDHVDVVDGQWAVSGDDPSGTGRVRVQAEALVVTGIGDPLRIDPEARGHPRVFDGRSYWTSVPAIKNLRPKSIAVVGSGETAGSIGASILQQMPDIDLTMINPTGASYSRGESFAENRAFSDPTGWSDLRERDRREFIRRTDRSVVSFQAKSIIERSENATLLVGRAVRIRPSADSVELTTSYGAKTRRSHYDVVVMGTGFHPTWFLRAFAPLLRKALATQLGGLAPSVLTRRIVADLSVAGVTPKLHLPMLAALNEGPGFPNLSCLGLLSDRLLGPYVRAATRTASASATGAAGEAAVHPSQMYLARLPPSE
jgi:mycobactin lysine-N-oxygenase